MNRGMQSSRRLRGSVILLVLVTVLLVAFLLTKFVQRAGTELLTDARAADQTRLRRVAYSALEVTLAVLADFRAQDRGLFSPAQGWDQPLAYAGYTPPAGQNVTITVEDESGKLSLPHTAAATLEVLLEILGLSRNDAERVADALLVWTRADHVAKSVESDTGKYERAALPHHPAGRPLRSFAELAAVATARDFFFDEHGQPTQLARDFAANVSLYSFERMNLNAATPAGLAVGGLEVHQMDALQQYRRQQERAGRPAYFRAVSEAAATVGAAPAAGLWRRGRRPAHHGHRAGWGGGFSPERGGRAARRGHPGQGDRACGPVQAAGAAGKCRAGYQKVGLPVQGAGDSRGFGINRRAHRFPSP